MALSWMAHSEQVLGYCSSERVLDWKALISGVMLPKHQASVYLNLRSFDTATITLQSSGIIR